MQALHTFRIVRSHVLPPLGAPQLDTDIRLLFASPFSTRVLNGLLS